MPNESLQAWAEGLVTEECQAFERARCRFARKPTAERLHKLRTTARRLRSLLEDVGDIVDGHRITCRLKPLIRATGASRDAVVTREALCAALDDRERDALDPMLHRLHQTERKGRRKACKRARRTSVA